MRAICSGSVNTTWKYSTGNSSSLRASIHLALAMPPLTTGAAPLFDLSWLRPTLLLRRWSAMAIAARVEAGVGVRAPVALFDVAAEGRRAAVDDGIHGATLLARQTMAFAICGTVGAKNVGQLE